MNARLTPDRHANSALGSPTVSVVIPAYQAQDTVGAAISSVLTQQFPVHEIVVVDDGSSDATTSVVRGYKDRVRLISRPNGGPSAARNSGWRATSAQLVAFVDADDILLPNYLKTGVERWQKAGCGRSIVIMNAYFLRGEISYTRQVLSVWPPHARSQRKAILKSNIASTFCIVPRDLLNELDGFDEQLRAVEDWDIMLRAVLVGAELLFLTRPRALYRWRPTSQSSDLDQMYSAEEQMFRKVLDSGALGQREREYVKSRITTGSPRALRAQADEAVLRADYRRARHLYGLAARMSPRDLKLQARRISLMSVPAAGVFWRHRMSGDGRVT